MLLMLLVHFARGINHLRAGLLADVHSHFKASPEL